MADDGTLIPFTEADPAKLKVKIHCHGTHCGGSIGVNWFTTTEEIDKPGETKDGVEVGSECHGSKCNGNVKIHVDWFQTEDGSLVGVPRLEEYKTKVEVGAKCNGRHCSGHISVGGDWYKAEDGTPLPVPKSNVAIIGGRIEVGSQCEGPNCDGILGVKVNWIETEDGNLVPIVNPEPAGGHVDVGADCKGSKCGGSINVGIEWFVTSYGTVVLIPMPAKTHITGGVECHGSHCSGNVGIGVDWFNDENVFPTAKLAKTRITGGVECHGSHCSGKIGVGVDWFKNENEKVIPIITPIPRPTGYNDLTGEIEYKRETKVVPIIPKDMPRLIKPKPHSEETTSYVKKIVLGEDGNPIEVIIDSDCVNDDNENFKCNEVFVGIRWLKLPSGEIVPELIQDENTPVNVSVEQEGPTTAKVKWGGKVHVKCHGRKCSGGISIGAHNRKRRDLGNEAVEISKTFLIFDDKDQPFDFLLHLPKNN